MDPSFLLGFPLLLALSRSCHTCDCKLQHPQTAYCTSDVVLLLNILGPAGNTFRKRAFRVEVIQKFKYPAKAPDINVIYTPLKRDDCGYEIRTSQQSQLLIAGILRKGKVQFTRCNLVYFWYRLSRQQKLGFQSEYSKGCGCEIQPCVSCSRTCQQPDINECLWLQRDCRYDIWQGDQSTMSSCLPSKSGRCEWSRVQESSTKATHTTSSPLSSSTSEKTTPTVI